MSPEGNSEQSDEALPDEQDQSEWMDIGEEGYGPESEEDDDE